MATLSYITVNGTYLQPDGHTPVSGYIEFRPSVPLSVSGTGILISEPIQANLDENGHFTIELLATDNGDLFPTGWSWFVDEKIKNGNTWYFQCPSTGNNPLNFSNIYYPPGASVKPPVVVLPGPAGVKGDKGIRGSWWYTGESNPPYVAPNENVLDKDLYLDVITGDVFENDVAYAGAPYGYGPFGEGFYGGTY